jgi:putative intracellular protease/amidase/uncharacterized protein YndB with AHSA1/START domain
MTTVHLLAFEGMDLMDLTGPLEVLLTADRLLERSGEAAAFRPVVVGRTGEPVAAYGGLRVLPDAAADAAVPDVLVVPGAITIAGVLDDEWLVAEVGRCAGAGAVITSVCTGAFALAAAGLLADRPWTTHWEDLPDLAQRWDRAVPGARVVDAGPVVTAGGLTCGIDLGLHLVARYGGAELARLVARQMDYVWHCFGDPSGGAEPVRLERSVAASPQQVYRLWTSAEEIRAAIGAGALIDPVVGGRYEWHFLADAPDGYRGGEGCRILAMAPDELLVFTWNSPPGTEIRGVHTWVVVQLLPEPTGCRVRLTHWGHGEGAAWEGNRAYFAAAWSRVLDRVAAHFAVPA